MNASGRPVPPPEVDYVDAGDFLEVGDLFAGYCRDLAGLPPDGRVLDVGCGLGRLAVGLADHLGRRGSYDGLDIVGSGIEWCRREVAGRYPYARFHVADLYHPAYNPAGRQRADVYSFPFADASFDLVVLRSVFTHLLPSEVERYSDEMVRVLVAGGRCLLTFFLLNPESRRLLETLRLRELPYEHGIFRSAEADGRGSKAYDEPWVREVLSRRGLDLAVYYGSWCGRESSWLSSQDMVVGTKGARPGAWES